MSSTPKIMSSVTFTRQQMMQAMVRPSTHRQHVSDEKLLLLVMDAATNFLHSCLIFSCCFSKFHYIGSSDVVLCSPFISWVVSVSVLLPRGLHWY